MTQRTRKKRGRIRYRGVGAATHNVTFVRRDVIQWELIDNSTYNYKGFQELIYVNNVLTSSQPGAYVGALFVDYSEYSPAPLEVLFKSVLATTNGALSSSVELFTLSGTLISTLTTSNTTPTALSASVKSGISAEPDSVYLIKVSTESNNIAVVGSVSLLFSGS